MVRGGAGFTRVLRGFRASFATQEIARLFARLREFLHEFCANFAQISREVCAKFAQSLQECYAASQCTSFARVLREFCACTSFAKVLQKFYKSCARVLHMFCASLRTLCASFFKISRDFCVDLARLVRRVYKTCARVLRK